MASIRQRKNGNWQAKVRRKGMPPATMTFDLKADAETWAREVERDVQRGHIGAVANEAGKITFKDVADRYIKSVVPTKKAKSAETYVKAVRDKFAPYFLSALRPMDIGDWRDELAKTYAPQSVIHHLSMLSAIYSFAEKDLGIHLPAGNPVRGVRKPKQPKARDRRLRGSEYDYLLRAASMSRSVGMRQIVVLAVETSMRLGELLGLEWSRVDLKRRTAHLRDTKNDSSRTVALSSQAVEALESLPRRLDGKVLSWTSGPAFEKTWQVCRTRARKLYEADCAATGTKPDPAFLADLRFHDLRHEATSRLFEKGLGIMEVASMTGHKSLAMLKRYTHVEAEKLARKLG